MKVFALLLVAFCIISTSTSAQKKPLLNNYDEVVARAKAELDSMLQTGARLQVEAAKRGLQGEYIMDLTIYDKGQIQSVFMVNSNADNAPMQNRVKDFVRSITFGFKVPKGTNYKIRYTFQF
jgi:hypothetical protein